MAEPPWTTVPKAEVSMYQFELWAIEKKNDGTMYVYPTYGVESLPAICQYGQDVTYTKWGVTGTDLEPKSGSNCVKFCQGGTGTLADANYFASLKMPMRDL